jgi:hypothetical protein
MGMSFQHEEKLSNKRFRISCELIGEEDGHGSFISIVLFHTPSNFVIEYLRVDIDSPVQKRVTIIDGRRSSKEWVEQMSENDINKRLYPRFRQDDKIKY